MDRNLPPNAGYTGSIPGLEESHMPQSYKTHGPHLLSLHSRAHERQLARTCNGEYPHALQLEKAHGQQGRPSITAMSAKKVLLYST